MGKVVLGLSVVAAVSLAGYGVVNYDLDKRAEKRFDEVIAKANKQNPYMEIKHGEYGINLLSTPVIEDIVIVDKISNKEIYIGDAKISRYDFVNDHPRYYEVEINSVLNKKEFLDATVQSKKERQEVEKVLSQISKDENIHINTMVNYNYTPENNNSVYQSVSFEVENAFDIKVDVDMDNLNADVISNILDKADLATNKDILTLQTTVANAKLNSFTLELKDLGLFDIAIKAIAEEEGVTVAQAKASILEQHKKELDGLKKQGVDKFSNELIKFVDDSHNVSTIKVSIKPIYSNLAEASQKIMGGVMMGQADPKDIIKDLNIEFKVY